MKNKKGFTLIEIIICLVLITGIGTLVTINVLKYKNPVDKNVTDRILAAAIIFIENEKDENGNYYTKGIAEGGQGVIIPITDLVNKGYVSEKDYKVVLTEVNKDKTYVVVGYKTAEDCKIGYEVTVGWDAINKENVTKYICSYTKDTKNTTIQELVNTKNTLCPIDKIDDYDYGKFCYLAEENKFYYKHKVKNNYVKFGKNRDTNEDLLWRILYIQDGKVKLVLNDVILSSLPAEKYKYYYGNFSRFCEYDSGCSGYYIKYERISNTLTYNIKYRKNSYADTESIGKIELYDSENYINKWVFIPLENWIKNTNLNDLIHEKSKWCIDKVDTCQANENEYIELKVGLMYKDDYKLNGYDKKDNNYLFNIDLNSYSNNTFNQVREVVIGSSENFEILYSSSYFSGDTPISSSLYIRPTIYLDLDRFKSVGDGTIENPYIAE